MGPTSLQQHKRGGGAPLGRPIRLCCPLASPPAVQHDAGRKADAHGNLEGHTAAGDKVVTDGNVKNYRRASDRLKEVGRRREEATSSRLV